MDKHLIKKNKIPQNRKELVGGLKIALRNRERERDKLGKNTRKCTFLSFLSLLFSFLVPEMTHCRKMTEHSCAS